MMKAGRKRLILELAATGIAPPLVMLLLVFMRAARALVWIALPIFYLGRMITSLIDKVSPPQGAGWFEGLGTALIVDFILMWIFLWVILFAIVKLIEKLIERKKREA
jgi:hypothetical protein